MKRLSIALLLLATSFFVRAQEVIYEVSSPAYFDSNGDGQADTEGIKTRLEYLKRIGYTSIMLGEGYLPEFTSKLQEPNKVVTDDYKDLVVKIHRYNMRVYQGFNVNEVAVTHPWFTTAVGKPDSEYGKFLLYSDKENKNPLYVKKGSAKGETVQVNLQHTGVFQYYLNLLEAFAGKGSDAKENSGIDGYRFRDPGGINNAGLTDKSFWFPIMTVLQNKNEKVRLFVMPVVNDMEMALKSNATDFYANDLAAAMVSLKKDRIIAAADSLFAKMPDKKEAVVYTRQEDYRNLNPKRSEDQLKVMAAVNLLIGGVPSVSSGQEIASMPAKLDVNEYFKWYIPDTRSQREAWAKLDKLNHEYQQSVEYSLWSFYKDLITLRRRQPAIGLGSFKNVPNSNDGVLTFIRQFKNERVFVLINLTGAEQELTVTDYNLSLDDMQLLMGTANHNFVRGGRTVVVPRYWVQVWRFTK